LYFGTVPTMWYWSEYKADVFISSNGAKLSFVILGDYNGRTIKK
jgi:hypothetical protein